MPNSDQQSNSFDSQSPTYLGSEEQIAARLTAGVDNNIISPKHENVSRKEDREPLRTIGEFTLVRELGRGGMGVVYEATQASLDRRVALKTLPVSGRMDQRQIQRFQNEARAAAQLQHPNIVPVFSIGTEAGIHYYAMQLIPGHDLAHFIRQAKTLLESPRAPRSGDTPKFALGTTAQVFQPTPGVLRTGTDSAVAEGSTLSVPLSGFIDMMADHKSSVADRKAFESILQIGIQAAEALHFAHQLGIVHRDIKPSNLMLDNEGKLWVTDFGLAQIQGAGALTMTGEVIGTLRYMSPEQPLGQRVLVDQRTDVYSLGVTLYELLTFRKAFGGDTPKEIIRQVCFDEPVSIRRLNPRVPEDLETIVLKAMSKNPDDRYQSAQELADDLERFRTDQPISARRPTLLQQGRRWIRRHVALATSVAVGIVLLLLTSLTATGMIWNSLNAETQQRQRAESLLDKSEGLRLIANSALVKDENPGLALLLAVKGAELNPGVDANTALLNALGSNYELKAFSPRKEISDTLCVSPDGTRVVTTVSRSYFGRGNYPAIESDLITGEVLQEFDDGCALTSSMYSPDGKFLLMTSAQLHKPGPSASTDNAITQTPELTGTVTLWDAQAGLKRMTFNDSLLDFVNETQFSPDSSRVVLPGNDHTVKVYLTVNGQLELSLKGHTKKVISTGFSTDGKRLISVSEDSTIVVWDAASGNELQRLVIETDFKRAPTAALTAANQISISTSEGTELVSMETGKRVNPRHWSGTASKLSRDGELITVYSRLGRLVSVWDCRSLRQITEFLAPEGVISVGWSSDGKSLMVATASGVFMHRVEDGAVTAKLLGHADRVLNAAITPDGTRVVTTAYDSTVRVWSVVNGAELQTLLRNPAAKVPSSWFVSADSRHVAIAEKPVWSSEVLSGDGLTQSSPFSGRASRDSFDSDRLVTINDHDLQVWDSVSSRKVASLQIETDTIRSARTIPETDIVFVLLHSGNAMFWNLKTHERRNVRVDADLVSNFDVHPGNSNVLLAMRSGHTVVISAITGDIVQTLTHDHAVLVAKFSPSGSRILTIDSKDTTRIWDDGQLTPVKTLVPGKNGKCDRAVFSADEKNVVTWSELERDLVRCWNLETGELVRESTPVKFPGVALHASEPVAAIASPAEGLVLWNWLTGEQRQITSSPAQWPSFHGDRLIAIEAAARFSESTGSVVGYEGLPEFARSTIVIRDFRTGEVFSQRKLTAEPRSLKVSQTSGKMLLSTRIHNVAIVRMGDHQRISTIGKHSGPIAFISFVSGSEKVVCASMDGICTLWDLSGRLLYRFEGHQHPLVHADISPDGLRLATFDTKGNGNLWNIEDGSRIMELPGHVGPVRALQFSSSGKFLVAASSGAGVRIWDLIARTEKNIGIEGDVLHAAMSPDEAHLLVVTDPTSGDKKNSNAKLLGAEAFLINRHSLKKTPLISSEMPRSGKFSPDGTRIAVLSNKGTVQLFDSKSGKSVESFNPNRRLVFEIAFSPDGQSMLVRHDDELSLWNLQSYDELLRVPNMRHQEYLISLQTLQNWNPFSPDGDWIISATETIKKWPRNPMIEAIKRIPRPLTEQETKRFAVNLLSKVGVP